MKRTIVALLAAAALLVSPAAAEAKTYSHASATSKAHHCKANKGWNSAPGYGNKAQCVYVSAPKGYKLHKANSTHPLPYLTRIEPPMPQPQPNPQTTVDVAATTCGASSKRPDPSTAPKSPGSHWVAVCMQPGTSDPTNRSTAKPLWMWMSTDNPGSPTFMPPTQPPVA